MKKLNRKGFTLVELLAVIVILAIVVGISIPSVTSIINNSKNKAMGVAVESAADYISDQYDLYLLGQADASSIINELITAGTEVTYKAGTDDAKITALGFKPANVSEVVVKAEHDEATQKASICVMITKVPNNSEYYTTAHFGTDGAAKATAENKAGNACS